RLCRPRATVARGRSVAETAASARDRCTMPPCQCLSRSLVALGMELVHRWDTALVNLPVACVGPLVQSARSEQWLITGRREHMNWSLPACASGEKTSTRPVGHCPIPEYGDLP